MALDFENRDCRGVKLDRVPILVPKVVCPPSLGRGHEVFIARGSCAASDGTPGSRRIAQIWPLPKTKDGANTSVKSSTGTPRPHRQITVSLEKGPPVPSRNTIKQLLLAHSFNVSQELCFTPGSTASHAASTSIHSALEKVLEFAGARPDLVERIVTGRSASGTAFVQLDGRQQRVIHGMVFMFLEEHK